MYIYSHMHYDSFSIGLLLQSTWTLTCTSNPKSAPM